MDPQLSERLSTIERQVKQIYVSVEKTRKYFFWTLVISIIFVVLPAIGLMFALPTFLSNYVDPLQSLTSM